MKYFFPKTSRPAGRRGRGRAYTLIEVLLTVAILGLIGALVVPSLTTAGAMGVQAAARVVVADLLYAQNEAIAQQETRRVIFNVGDNGYRVADAMGNTINYPLNAGVANNYVVQFNDNQRFNGVTITAVDFGGSNEISYDELGGPSSGGSVTLDFERRSYRIDVAPFTGRVTVTQVS